MKVRGRVSYSFNFHHSAFFCSQARANVTRRSEVHLLVDLTTLKFVNIMSILVLKLIFMLKWSSIECFSGERSEAYSHKDTSTFFRFFPVCDIPLSSIFCSFLGTYWSDLSNFCMNTATVSRSNILQISGRQVFFGELIAKKLSIFGFFGKQRLCFYVLSLQ